MVIFIKLGVTFKKLGVRKLLLKSCPQSEELSERIDTAKRYAAKKLADAFAENFGDKPKEEILEVIGDVLAVKRLVAKGAGKGDQNMG